MDETIMQSISYTARQLNLFSRDASILTRADVCMTYIFVCSVLSMVCIYSIRYYHDATGKIHVCMENNDRSTCIRSEFIHIGVPFMGIIYGFISTMYKLSNIIALTLNYACCCYSICRSKTNKNDITVEVSANPIVADRHLAV